MLPTVFDAVGAKLDGSSGVQEPTAWILGGDLNCGPIYLSDFSNKYQAHDAAEGARVQQVLASTPKAKHGDIALVQHMQAYQV